MSVVTISRSLGSRGDYIGRRLAEETGYAYIDKDRIAEVIKEYGIIRLDDIYNSVTHLWYRIDEYRITTVRFLTHTIIAIAQHDNVIIAGRGSYGILQGFDNVLNVKIQAPFKLRALRQMEKAGIDFAEAEKTVKHDDHLRRKFIESFFYFQPDQVDMFDVVLDTGIVEPDECVRILAMIVNNGIPSETDYGISLDQHHTDPVLDRHVTKKLDMIRRGEL